jgi:penicillin-binding protein 2
MPATSTRFRDHWQEQRLFLTRIIAAAVIIAILSGVLVARLVMLQIVEYERFAELSLGNRFRLEPLPPTRGLIYDRHGLVIAENLPNWELVAIAEEIDNLDGTLKRLEELGLVDAGEHKNLRDLVRSHRGFERVKLSNLTEEQAATFAVRRHRFPGVDIQEALVRYYPFGEASAHAIGYVGSISTADLERIDRSDYAATSQIGKQGVERASFLPVLIDKKLRPEVLQRGDTRFDDAVKYMEWASEGYTHEFRVEGDEVVIGAAHAKGGC